MLFVNIISVQISINQHNKIMPNLVPANGNSNTQSRMLHQINLPKVTANFLSRKDKESHFMVIEKIIHQGVIRIPNLYTPTWVYPVSKTNTLRFVTESIEYTSTSKPHFHQVTGQTLSLSLSLTHTNTHMEEREREERDAISNKQKSEKYWNRLTLLIKQTNQISIEYYKQTSKEHTLLSITYNLLQCRS